MSDVPPPEIDLIGVLYGCGEMPLPIVHRQVGGPGVTWAILPGMVAAPTAAIWLDEAGLRRKLVDWEVASIFLNRTRKSLENVPPDACLIVCAAEKTSEAYDRDWAAWYYGR